MLARADQDHQDQDAARRLKQGLDAFLTKPQDLALFDLAHWEKFRMENEDAALAVGNAYRDLHARYAFYLLAVVGAAVGFSLNQTQGAVLAWSQIPLGLAIGSWVLSFWFGLCLLESAMKTLSGNSTLLYVAAGQHPTVKKSPKAINDITDELNQLSKRTGKFSKWQVLTLLTGVFFYVGWHVLEMYLRQPPTS